MTRTKHLTRLALLIAPIAVFALLAGCEPEEDAPGDITPAPTPVVTTAPTGNPDCQSPTGTVPEVTVKTYDQKPAMTIDAAKKYTADINTVRGHVLLELRPDLAPEHVNSFVFLARDGYYNGVVFHRVVPGFVAQAGDPTGSGSGGPGYTIPAEFTTAEKFERGTLGMARTNDPNSAGSQWFINYAATPNLDGEYTIFGKVTEGMDVVDCIAQGDAIISLDITESP
jgi:peptidylprolyl isomerase